MIALVVLFLLAATPALADGGPVTAMQGGTGVHLPGSPIRYVAVGSRHHTVVERIRGAAVRRWRTLRGSWGIAGVTWNIGTGLSGDGRTLVIARSTRRYPPRRSGFAVLGTGPRMRERGRFSLPGFYTLDAVSPRGRWAYLTHYTSGRSVFDYEVRAYDLRRHRLLPEPVVDRREPDEKMAGLALTRAAGPGGRWAYTLYQRPTGETFVHALDTAGRTAFCVDLEGEFLGDVPRLRLDGVVLHVGDDALIDTRSFAVFAPGLPLIAQASRAAHPLDAL